MLQMVIMKIDQAERYGMVANGEALKIKITIGMGGGVALRCDGYIDCPKKLVEAVGMRSDSVSCHGGSNTHDRDLLNTSTSVGK